MLSLAPVIAIIDKRVKRMWICQSAIGNLVVPIVTANNDLVSIIGMPGRIIRAVVC